LGFATFFLNRTNRSGVIKGAGVIGGLKQEGNYKIDCRLNREDLVRRVRRVAKYRSRIHLTNLDATVFMKSIDREIPASALYCIDPPYYSKGSSLYTNFYGPNEHERVSSTVLALRHPWIVTYDDVDEFRAIYRKRRQFPIAINYSIQTKRIGSELLIASKGLRLPKELRAGTFVAADFAIAS
jgi:DNA adenine methylase